MNITIEKPNENDAEELLQLMKTLGGESDNLLRGAEGLPITVSQEREYISAVNTSPHRIMLVARDGGTIIGSVSYESAPVDRIAHRGSLGISVLKA